MPFIAQVDTTKEIQTKLEALTEKAPNGEIPHKEELADLKGILPNPQTIREVLACGTVVPAMYLVDFDPESSVVTNVPIPQPKVELNGTIIDVVNREPEQLPPINTEGLTEEEIEKAEKERQRKQEIINKVTDAANKIEQQKAEIINKLGEQAEQQLKGLQETQGNLQASSLIGAMGGGASDIILKTAAYKFFKAQIAAAEEQIKAVSEEVDKTLEEAKAVLELETDAIDKDKELKEENDDKEDAAKNLEDQTATMTPTSPGHPGPGHKADGQTISTATALRNKADGFAKNLEQAELNFGEYLEDALEEAKKLLEVILKVVEALKKTESNVQQLKQLLEVCMMLLFFNCMLGLLNARKSPEQHLCDMGYPGFCGQEFKPPVRDISGDLTPHTFTESDLYDDQIVGTPFEGPPEVDLMNHPLLGDLSNIHPQITNELYLDGILDYPYEEDTTKFDEELDKLYDDILNDLTSTNNIEFIEHLYNLDFEKIGYKRYMAPEKMSDEDRPSGIL